MVNLDKMGYSDLYFIKSENILNFKDNVVLANVDKNSFLINSIFPIRSSFFSLFIIEKGYIEVELDYQQYLSKEYNFLILLPEHLIQSIKFSDDFKAQLAIIKQDYFSAIEMNNLRLYQPVFLNIRKFPKLLLREDEYYTIISCLDRLKQKINLQNHHLKEALVNNLLIEYLLEIDNILIDRKYNSNFQRLSRQEEIMSNFFQLLQENAKSEHKVVFYADKLHITTQYLAFVLNQLTGKTTHEWIANALMIEAKILLKHSQQTIQQVSDFFNFCDPSAFGKFFKNLTGVTPFQFRTNKPEGLDLD